MIQTIIFDFGGVIATLDGDEAIALVGVEEFDSACQHLKCPFCEHESSCPQDAGGAR